MEVDKESTRLPSGALTRQSLVLDSGPTAPPISSSSNNTTTTSKIYEGRSFRWTPLCNPYISVAPPSLSIWQPANLQPATITINHTLQIHPPSHLARRLLVLQSTSHTRYPHFYQTCIRYHCLDLGRPLDRSASSRLWAGVTGRVGLIAIRSHRPTDVIDYNYRPLPRDESSQTSLPQITLRTPTRRAATTCPPSPTTTKAPWPMLRTRPPRALKNT